MAAEVQNRCEPAVSTLVSGIVTDLHDLFKQQLQLTRREIEEDLRKAREAAFLFALGAGICFLGGVALCFMMVHLLHWLASPHGTDPAWLPLWACHGGVGLVLVVIGASLAYTGRQKLQSVNPLDNPATEALQENVQWLTTPK
jgi:Putative Actinobacterial Holin-X, holin superfamily III